MPLDSGDRQLFKDELRGVSNAVDALSGVLTDIADRLFRLPLAQERRRYELLRAAAMMMGRDTSGFDHAYYVRHAAALLDEIEKREKAEGQS